MRRRVALLLLAVMALALVPTALSGSVPLPTRLASALAVRGNTTALSSAVAADLETAASSLHGTPTSRSRPRRTRSSPSRSRH